MQRGEIFRLRAPRGARGHEQAGRRYGVVLQADSLLELSTVIVAPTSTRVRPTSFRPEVLIDGTRASVLVEQLGAVDPGRLGESTGLLAWNEMKAVERALTLVLGLES